MYDGYDYKFPPQEGWVCPKCGRVYSPTTFMCYYCGEEEKVTYTTNTNGTFYQSNIKVIHWTECKDCCYEPGTPNCPSYGTVTARSGCFKGIEVPKKSK